MLNHQRVIVSRNKSVLIQGCMNRLQNRYLLCFYVLIIPRILWPLIPSIDVSCARLSNPRNGRVRIRQTTFGSSANYSCNSGYGLVGVNTRLCEENGQWSDSAPSCRSKTHIILQVYIVSRAGNRLEFQYQLIVPALIVRHI